MAGHVYFAFDTETTGLEYGYHEILQLSGMLLDENFNKISRLAQMKLMPDHWDRAEAKALEVNGADIKTWKATHGNNKESLLKMNALLNSEVEPGVNIIPFGHNVSFDTGHLIPLMKKEGVTYLLHYHALDTMQMMRTWSIATKQKIYDYRLVNCCRIFSIEIGNAHEASADIIATVKLGLAIIADLKTRMKHGEAPII